MTLPNQWGYKSKIKWVLIEEAPLTASGLNEILFAAQHRKALVDIARQFGYRRYKIVKLDDIKENAHGEVQELPADN